MMKYTGDKGSHAEEIRRRNERIFGLYQSGIPKGIIAKRFGLSATQIFKIIQRMEGEE